MTVKNQPQLPRKNFFFFWSVQTPWWDFVQADQRSAEFRKYFCDIAVPLVGGDIVASTSRTG